MGNSSDIRVVRAVFSSGERFPYLKGVEGFPLSLPTRYAVNRMRLRHQAKSIEGAMRAIARYYEWASNLVSPFDPETRLRSGDLHSASEITGLARFLRTLGRPKVVPLALRPVAREWETGVRSNNDFNRHLYVIRDFVSWAAGSQRKPKPEKEAIDHLRKCFEAEVLPTTEPERRRGLKPETERRVFEILTPGSPRNPFHPKVQFRNWLVVRILRDTGMRRGELCKLRVEDFVTLPGLQPYLRVRRRPDDRDDPRRYEPQVKTRERRLPIAGDLVEALIRYLRRDRGRVRHPYLITSTRGNRPIDVSVVNRIVAEIKVVIDPCSLLELTPHLFRYTFFERIAVAARTAGFTEERIGRIERYLGGWSESSDQAYQYNRAVVESEAQEIMIRMNTEAFETPCRA